MAEPAVTDHAYHVSSGSNLPPTRVVVHDTESGGGYPSASQPPTARGVVSYFTQPSSGGSAHYIVDTATEFHVLGDTEIGWHAPPNARSIGIEICGVAAYTRDQWLSASVWPAVALAARRTRELCDRFGIPTVRLSSADLLAGRHGICGHVDVSQAWHQSDHSDPGPNFPWDRFMAAVTGSTPAPTATAPSPVKPATPPAPSRVPYVVHGAQHRPSNPTFTRWLQGRLGVSQDGQWGDQTDAALAALQTAHSLTPDKIIGPATARALGAAWVA